MNDSNKKEELIITQSPNDNNKYRYVKLKNDLEVVLVSDENCDQASGCLALNVGSICNPKDIEGLAHFLEHMLFLGTEKYPVEKEFVQFITTNGGSYNATTAANKTNYYFSVNQESFKEALDRFSSFFISPLMNEDAVNRELNAVDSEHNNNMQKDNWRIDRIINDQFEGHPLSSFFTGDSSTLKRDDIRERVVEFFKKYYSANLMKVSIYGRETLDQLEEYANKYFSEIKNSNVKLPDFPPLTMNGKSIWIEAEPAKDTDLLKIVFPIPDESLCFSKNYKEASGTLLSHILGHESKGSLLSVLIEKDYAFTITCGNSSIYDNMNKVELVIILTKTGIENIDEIIALTFQYIDFPSVPDYVYEEKKQINEINWKSFQKSSPISTTTAITSNLFRVETPKDTLKYNHFYERFNTDEIKRIQSYLRPDNMVVLFYSASKFKGKTTLVEPHYNIKFNKRYITDEDIKKWKSYPKHPGLYIPLPNPFIPKDFTIKAPQDGTIQIPKLAYSKNGVNVYHSLDHRFNSPKVRVNIRFETLSHGNNQSMVMWNLLKKATKEVLNEKILYYLMVLEFSMKIQILTSHVELISYGFNDKIFEAIQELFNYYYSFDLTDTQFKRAKEKLVNRFHASHYLSPYQISFRALSLHTLNCNSNLLEKEDFLKKLTKSDFVNYIRNLFSYINFTVLVVGNASQEDACQFGDILNSFDRRSSCVGDCFKLSRVNLKPGIQNILKEHLYDVEQTNCAVSMGFLAGNFTRKNNALTFVMSTIIHSIYFDELRSKQQFGYVVIASNDSSANAHLIRFFVQSHTKTPDEIYDATMSFLVDFEKDLISLETNKEAFEDLIDNCQKQQIVKQHSNSAQSSLYWNNFILYGDFEFEKKFCQDIGEITIQDLKQYYYEYLSPNSKSLRVFASQVYPQSSTFSTDQPENININILKSGQHYDFRNKHGFLPSSSVEKQI